MADPHDLHPLARLRSYADLRAAATSADATGPAHRLAVIADTNVDHYCVALRGEAACRDLPIIVLDCGSGDIARSVLVDSSELNTFAPDTVVLWHSSRLVLSDYHRTPEPERPRFARMFADSVQALVDALTGTIFIVNVPEIDDGVFGNFGNEHSGSWRYQRRTLNVALMDIAVRQPNCHILDLCQLSAQDGVGRAVDPRLIVSADVHLSLDFLAELAKNTIDLVSAVAGNTAKCLVLDLDNTLWGGILADDGRAGIQLAPDGLGRLYHDVQRWAQELGRRGILLAVASKNDPAIVDEVFDHHPDMVLRRADIAVFELGWHSKVDSLKSIAAQLGIGLSHIVFVDDDAVERARVRSFLPDVVVPDLPSDPAAVLQFLQRLNLFELSTLTATDARRTALYADDARRHAQRRATQSEAEFLAELHMAATRQIPDDFVIARVAQLFNRANQFNLCAVRLSESEVAHLAQDPDHEILAFKLVDRFGDYGTVGAMILQAPSPDRVSIEHWVISCRALQRGLEDVMLEAVVEYARVRHARQIVGRYVPTGRNSTVQDLYPGRGFRRRGADWVLDVTKYRPAAHHIRRC